MGLYSVFLGLGQIGGSLIGGLRRRLARHRRDPRRDGCAPGLAVVPLSFLRRHEHDSPPDVPSASPLASAATRALNAILAPVTSNVGQSYPYTSETEASGPSGIAAAIAAHKDLAAKLDAETTPLDARDRWWTWKCPTTGCPGSSTRPATPATSTPCTSSATGPAARRSCADRHRRRWGPSRRQLRGRIALGLAVGAIGLRARLRPDRARGRVLAARGRGDERARLRRRGAVRRRRVRGGGLAWPAIVLLTAFLNARHLLYAVALAPYLREAAPGSGGDGPPPDRRGVRARDRPLPADRPGRCARLLARGDRQDGSSPGTSATLAGVVLGGRSPTRAVGLDVIFPAAMGGLAVGLITGRRELVAAIVGAGVAVGVALVRARRSGSSRRGPRTAGGPARPEAVRRGARSARIARGRATGRATSRIDEHGARPAGVLMFV